MTEAVLGARPIGQVQEEEKSKWERLLLFLIFLLFLFSVYKVFFETSAEYGSGQVVASAYDPRGDVKRRANDRFVWSDVRSNLFLKDSVRTTEKSALTLKFPDGGFLEMAENSLVTLDMVNGKLTVNVAGGTMNFKAGSGGLVLNAGGKTITATDGAGSLSAGAGGTTVALTTGTATLSGKDGKTEAIGKDSQVKIGADGQTKIDKVPAYLNTPLPGENFVGASKGADIAFSWKPVEGVADLTIQVSEYPDFSMLKKSVALKPGQVNVNLNVAEGNYYWRIISKGMVSEERKFSVTTGARIAPIEPQDGAKFGLAHTKTEVVFNWEGSLVFDQYNVRVATDPNFQNIVNTVSSDGHTQAVIPFEKEGKYYWRVEASSSATKATAATVGRTLYVQKTDKALPVLLWPLRNATINYVPERILFIPIPKAHVKFRWERVTDVSKYTLEASPTPDFKKKVLDEEVEGNSYEWTTRETGQLYWRVSVAPGVVTAPSNFKILSDQQIELAMPEDHQSIIYPRAKPAMKFQWKGNAKGTYVIEFSDDGGFSKPVFTKRVVGNHWTSNTIEDGQYYWRVSQLDSSGAVSQVSSSRIFDLEAANLLPAPTMRMPFKDAKFGLGSSEFVFNWDVVPGARKYELVIERLVDSKKIVKTSTIGVAKVKDLTPGMFKWTVTAVDEFGRLGKKNPAWNFTIINKVGPNAPRFLGLEIRDLFGGKK